MPKVFVVQKPRHSDNFDMDALAQLGEVVYMLPAAPNAYDLDRQQSDLRHMTNLIQGSAPEDVFIALGGSPHSHWLLGAAFMHTDKERINTAVFSRGRDIDGRRDGVGGKYTILPLCLHLPEGTYDD